MTANILRATDADSVLPAARTALADLRARGVAHRYVRHVRSSQAFALSLFAPLDQNAVKSLFAALGHPEVVAADAPVFEYEDHTDRLQEASPRSRHRTQVDVLLRGVTQSGTRIAALIEVKLGETDFGGCSAFSSTENPDRDNCGRPGLFGDDPARCFQLQNHGRGHRKYAEYLAPSPVEAPSPSADRGGCWVRGGTNQPMRNLALGHLLVASGDVDEVVYALCAPTGHQAIWRRFTEFQALFPDADAVTIRSLSAETVASRHADGGTALVRRYSPAMSHTALLHMSVDGTSLHGIWMHRDGHLTSFYDIDTEAESNYAESVLLGQSWENLLDELPRRAPYLAWWEKTTCAVTEPIENAFDRIVQLHFAE